MGVINREIRNCETLHVGKGFEKPVRTPASVEVSKVVKKRTAVALSKAELQEVNDRRAEMGLSPITNDTLYREYPELIGRDAFQIVDEVKARWFNHINNSF